MDKDQHACAVCGAHNEAIGAHCVSCGYAFQSARDYAADKAEQALEERMLHGDGDDSLYAPDWITDVKGRL